VVPTFAQWLRNHTDSDADLTVLKDYANGHANTWPWWTDDKSSYERHIDDNVTDTNAKLHLKDILNKYYNEWSSTDGTRPVNSNLQSLINFLNANLTALLFAFFTLAILIVLIWGFFNPTFFNSIARVEQARGLITFLFAFSTMATDLSV
jgi:hypothetical protein